MIVNRTYDYILDKNVILGFFLMLFFKTLNVINIIFQRNNFTKIENYFYLVSEF